MTSILVHRIACALLGGLALEGTPFAARRVSADDEPLRFACVTPAGKVVAGLETWEETTPEADDRTGHSGWRRRDRSAPDWSAFGAALLFVRVVGEHDARAALNEAHARLDARRRSWVSDRRALP